MPYRRRRRTTRKRNWKKKGFRMNAPLATKLASKLIYEEQFNLNPSLGGLPAQYVLSANGLYDPNVGGSGHQPRGFDQLMSLYTHATVVGCKVTAVFHNVDSGNTQCVAIMPSDNLGSISDPSDILESPRVKFAKLSTLGSGQEMKTLSAIINPNKYLGISKPLSEDTVKNSSTDNPLNEVYFKLIAWNQAGSDSGNVEVTVRAEYSVIFTEPKVPNQS